MTARKGAAIVALAATVAGTLASCGRSFDEKVTVEPADVRGTVGGLVFDFRSGDPIEGLAITVIAGDGVRTGTTSADGLFAVPMVPAGAAVIVRVDGASSFTSAELTVALPVSAGQVPLAMPETFVGPIGLLPRDLDLALQLVRDDGTALEATITATTSVGWFDLSTGAPLPRGNDEGVATSLVTGIATIDSLADVATLPGGVGSDVVTFTVPPIDDNGDGAYEFEGVTFSRAARDLAAGLEIVNVDSEATSLTVVSSNVQGLLGLGGDTVPSVVGVMESIRLVFNQPVDPASISFTVSDESGTDLAGPAVAAPSSESPNTVVLSPPATGWPAGGTAPTMCLPSGREHNVEVHAVSGDNSPALRYDAGAAFFTEDPTCTTVTATAVRDSVNPDLVRITFSEPIGITPGAAWALSGAACVVFIGRDVDGTGTLTGVNEIAGPSCNITLSSDEIDPVGIAGPSGFTTRADYFLPTAGLIGSIPFELRFDRVTPATSRPTTASGAIVGNITMLTAN